MLLSNSLVWALENYDISGIKVFCDEALQTEISEWFMEDFRSRWEDALEKVEEEYGDCESKEKEYFPIEVDKTEYGFFISVFPLEIRYCWGDYYEPEYGYEAFNNSLEELKVKYPEVEYEGYLGYPVCDVRAGEIYQCEISSTGKRNPNKCYDFIGKKLNACLRGEILYIPEEPKDAEEMTFVVTGKLQCFENREELTEYIESLGANVSGSISKKTDYLINNDIASASSKNKKAKELGIPIITEKEFICRFGNPEDYDIDTEADEFWDCWKSELESEEDFEESIKCLYGYREWIEKDTLDRAIRAIIDIAQEIDEDMPEQLAELVRKLEAGEEIETKEDDLGNDLPDGYMEALDMFMMAEELGFLEKRRNEVQSSEEVFGLVVREAEAGNIEAKFIAGKYFLADNIEEEKERAIRWLKEAAEHGIEEANAYLK